MTTKTPKQAQPQMIPELPADLDLALRRLKLAAIRRTAPEVLLTAKTQRWTPEEVVRTLVETEISARDASNIRNRLKAAAFPVAKTLESFDVAASSIQPKVFDYLSPLEWIRTQHNLTIIGPAGTGKSHTLIGLIIDKVGFAPLDDTGTQLLFRLVAGAYERRSLAIASHWPFEDWGRFLPEHTTAASILDRLLHHAK